MRTVLVLALTSALCLWNVPAGAQNAFQGEKKLVRSSATLRIRSFIDGRSWFAVQDSRLWIRHLDWVAPGRWTDRNLPTTVDGSPWFPEWPFGEDEGLHCRCDSSGLELKGFVVPPRPVWVDLKELEGRGKIRTVESPGIGNGFRLVVEIDDFQPGAAWYEFEIILAPR